MNQNWERYEANKNVAKLFCDGMITVNTLDRVATDIANTTGYTKFDIMDEINRLVDLYNEAELV